MQEDFFSAGMLTIPAQPPRPAATLPGHSITVSEKPFGYSLPVADLRRLCPERLPELLAGLKTLGDFQIRLAENRGGSFRKVILNVAQRTGADDGDEIQLPKGSHAGIVTTLARFGIAACFQEAEVADPLLDTLGVPFRTGVSLDDVQRQCLKSALQARHSRIIDFGMAGGKSLLIAATLRAQPNLRPAIVTGNASNDSAQLAVTLAQTLDEPVCLLGCAGGIPTSLRRQLFVHERSWKEARIIVGTHCLLQNVRPVTLEINQHCLPHGDDSQPSSERRALGATIAAAPLLIADEVDTLPTIANTAHLLGMQPKRVFGFTGTWGRRSDRMDAVLLSLISPDGPMGSVVRAGHQVVATTGRVASMAIHGYEFAEEDYPREDLRWISSTTPLEVLVTEHRGRNRFCAELASYAMDLAGSEHGVAIAFVKTIEHSFSVLEQLCQVRQLPFDKAALQAAGIIVHNAQLRGSQKVQNLQALRDGDARLIITTDSLAVGVDCAEVSDIVDLTGRQEVRQSLQRAGRALRQAEGKLVARYHFIADTHHPALVRIAQRKRVALEGYFGREAITHARAHLPWRRPLVASIDASSIEAELRTC